MGGITEETLKRGTLDPTSVHSEQRLHKRLEIDRKHWHKVIMH
jgi:hypothetical protein